ncbi:hypothetical protein COEREDRAFT_87652 [Coemansia reversa NRRL 1564]|uniref:Uncharacterized protein n=1 Tax=Coemansia reversa (strain ATCC 12441 / NRRL 1564) TaxID=763665 RepID=A0A2G5B9K7_COERN|nr:hypothetical protein COEREDRAFT_87652 [Coemansia reversa NRRL 1564]|eukprot:PIA15691.1 hypothetical protein COEREDRAFT_87652 [Coemansia reversa NRRL 1564]
MGENKYHGYILEFNLSGTGVVITRHFAAEATKFDFETKAKAIINEENIPELNGYVFFGKVGYLHTGVYYDRGGNPIIDNQNSETRLKVYSILGAKCKKGASRKFTTDIEEFATMQDPNILQDNV